MADDRKPEAEQPQPKPSQDELMAERGQRRRTVTRSPRDRMLRPGLTRGFETK